MSLSISKFSPRSFDWVLIAAVFLLLAIGGEAIYSVDLSHGANLTFFKKQLLAAGIGAMLLVITSLLQHTFYRSYAKLAYLGSLALLVLVLVFGKTIRDTTGWFVLGGFSFQPVEAAKVGVILILAYIIAHFGRRFEQPLFFFGTAIVTGLVMFLVMLQPDLGSAILVGCIWLGLVLLVGTRRLYLLSLFGGVIAVAVFSWYFLFAEYQRDRLRNFINPERDPLGSGYNVTQSVIAVGSGKFFGRGLGFGSQSQLRFLPEAQTDFIFSVIAEELGFIGVSVVAVLYGIIFWRLIRIMKNSTDDFSAATVAGITIVLFSQFFINCGAEIGLLPVTGVTLPFISYGGSSLIMSLMMIGIAQSMMVKRY